MNYSIEKNEQYALIRLTETIFGEAITTDFETLSRNLFREGYSNIIIDTAAVQSIDPAGVSTIRKISRQCTNEQGLLIVVTKNDDLISFLDTARLSDLTILPTVEEAIDAVFMNELENDFRSEADDEYDVGGSVEA
ncbi:MULTISPECIES: STAS domain-containing protein [unclassified Spirosoma]|uniref:STAS domain-containing protein n=1 Tax=unclassified Spirosoma TaxID=2621999 RepID=UPI000959E5D9|nr:MULTISPECIES: STAS domain-containing protein [unclassified Spirosoma]MBN8822434.1 STAS domain-containing protein [Spirosoma sp.]OJW73950.1 MAG: anti-anti-sigma factor [Spirosoma sp. 48-14]